MELGRSPRRLLAKTTRALTGPKGAITSPTAVGIPLNYPVPLRLAEALLELRPSRLATLCDELLVGPIEIGVILGNGPIEARPLIDCGGRVTRIA